MIEVKVCCLAADVHQNLDTKTKLPPNNIFVDAFFRFISFRYFCSYLIIQKCFQNPTNAQKSRIIIKICWKRLNNNFKILKHLIDYCFNLNEFNFIFIVDGVNYWQKNGLKNISLHLTLTLYVLFRCKSN